MFSGLRAIDISLPLRDGMVRWPGDPPFVREEAARLDRGDGVALSVVRMGVHAGSHVDFPAHLLPGGTGADAWPPGSFLLPAMVVEHTEGREVPADALAGLAEAPGEAILFRTGNSVRGLLSGRSPLGEASCLAPAAARACVARRAALVAIDGLSVDRMEDPLLPVHRILLSAGIPILEGVDLSAAPPGRCTLACFPLRIEGSEASPVRAVLLYAK